ncbi:MAG: hypothetical protein IPJ71_19655 [Bdellovibrionales bacterium]|nr:hypothetical protein [Bdellovibrionales bacterium]
MAGTIVALYLLAPRQQTPVLGGVAGLGRGIATLPRPILSTRMERTRNLMILVIYGANFGLLLRYRWSNHSSKSLSQDPDEAPVFIDFPIINDE